MKKNNYLNYIPHIKSEYKYTDENKVCIFIKRTSFFDKIMCYLLSKPRVITMTLDDLGSYAWKNIDGVNSLQQIASILHKKEESDSLEIVEIRTVQFFLHLKDSHFITFSEVNK